MLLSISVQATEPTSVTQDELEELLIGNTITGVWDSHHYRQYFDNNGDTVYVEKGRPPTTGKWRISALGMYCSSWSRSQGEACYAAKRDGKQLLWEGRDGNLYRSDLVTGRQLDW